MRYELWGQRFPDSNGVKRDVLLARFYSQDHAYARLYMTTKEFSSVYSQCYVVDPTYKNIWTTVRHLLGF